MQARFIEDCIIGARAFVQHTKRAARTVTRLCQFRWQSAVQRCLCEGKISDGDGELDRTPC
jgi:hypothetical protein